jgi:hypothetical protein
MGLGVGGDFLRKNTLLQQAGTNLVLRIVENVATAEFEVENVATAGFEELHQPNVDLHSSGKTLYEDELPRPVRSKQWISTESTIVVHENNLAVQGQDRKVVAHKPLLIVIDTMFKLRYLRTASPSLVCMNYLTWLLDVVTIHNDPYDKAIYERHFVICMDGATHMPKAKAGEWAKRAKQMQACNMYKIDDNNLPTIDDSGIRWPDGRHDSTIDMTKVMDTRRLRPIFFKYFIKWLASESENPKFPSNVVVTIDAGVDLVWNSATQQIAVEDETELLDSTAIVPPHFISGSEGELKAMWWACQYATSHHIVLMSGDYDMLCLAWLHTHKFNHSLTVYFPTLKTMCCPRNVLRSWMNWKHTAAFPKCVTPNLMAVVTWKCLQLMIGGTDFVIKKTSFHRKSDQKMYVAIPCSEWLPLHTTAWTKNTNPMLTSEILLQNTTGHMSQYANIAHGLENWDMSKTLVDDCIALFLKTMSKVVDKSCPHPAVLVQALRKCNTTTPVSRKRHYDECVSGTKKQADSLSAFLDTAEQLQFNLNYWKDLQYGSHSIDFMDS